MLDMSGAQRTGKVGGRRLGSQWEWTSPSLCIGSNHMPCFMATEMCIGVMWGPFQAEALEPVYKLPRLPLPSALVIVTFKTVVPSSAWLPGGIPS